MTARQLEFRIPLLLTLLVALNTAHPPASAKPVAAPFDYSALEKMAILDDARAKPLDTFARETMRLVTSREYWSEGKAPHPFLTRDPMTNLLSLLFEPDKWKEIPCIFLVSADVKKVLGVDPLSQWISYNELRANSGLQDAFKEVMRKQQAEESATPLDRHIGDLHGVLNRLDGIFYGTDIKVVPIPMAGDLKWISLDEMAGMQDSEPLRANLEGMLTGFTTGDAAKFTTSVQSLATQLRTRGGSLYPTEKVLGYEVTYNETKPFRKAWIFLLLGTILFAVSMGIASRLTYYAAWAFTVTGFGLSSFGLMLRVLVAGRPPVSNMYESVVYMGWGVLLFAGIFELIYRQRIFGLCGAAMGVVVLTLADMLPFDPAISPLVPVLRSNYWLLIHVMTIVISYSAFALAMAIAHLSLSFYLFTPQKKDLIRTTNNFVYRAIQVGVLLLTAGTILGGVWANESWGRFWGWDPKETWAFISIVGYLVLLHSRYSGLVGPFGVSVGAVVGFQLILMTWYGVNFVLAAGLHSYGFGTGGQGYVIGYLAVETLFLVMVAVRYKFFGTGLKQVLQEEASRSKMRQSAGNTPQPTAT
jgi:cytochrome c-type biogenesis protein CcsB